MKKQSKAIRLGVLALALTLVSTCLMGATMAKYTTTVSGTGTAVVAKWAVKAGDKDGATTIDAFTLSDTATAGVASGKIAPGTKGSLPVYIDLTGTEVATKVTVEVKVDDPTKLPDHFVMKNADNNTIILSGVNQTVYTKELSAADAAKFKQNVAITWEWPYLTNSQDEVDTADGEGAETTTFTVTVTATQLEKDPTATP